MMSVFGNVTSELLTALQKQSDDASTSTTTTSTTLGSLNPSTTNLPLGISPGKIWVSNNVGTSITSPPPPTAIGANYLSLTRTADGEFILQGPNAQRLLMEYFEQSPELWLRLMALRAGEEVE